MMELVQKIQDVGYVATVNGGNIILDYLGEGNPDESIVRPLIDQLRENKAAIIAQLETGGFFNWEPVDRDQPPSEVVITAEDLLRQPVSSLGMPCHWCGRKDWWTKSCGQRVCGLCHPKPKTARRTGS